MYYLDAMKTIAPTFPASAWFWPVMLCGVVLGAPCFGQAPITNGLVARWSGDGNAKDSAGHFDGKVSGGLSYVPGPTDQAFKFNGGGAQADFGNSAGNFGTRDFTIAYWMKTGSTRIQEAFLEKRAACNAGSFFGIRLGSRIPANGLPVHIGQPGLEIDGIEPGTHVSFMASGPFNDDHWHHFAWMRQSTSSGSVTYLVYVDGVIDNTMAVPDAADISNPSSFVMGTSVCECCDGTTPYSGAAAELQLFSHALTAEEIFAIYKAGK
jgi:hypothetical protein